MFSLIISIIAIALVAALALASIYYGGDAFQEGTAKAEASTVINQGQQIQAAVTMSEIDEKPVADGDMAALVTDNYLKEVPQVRGEDWTKSGDFVELAVETHDICKYIEAGFDSDTTLTDSRGDQAFGCFVADTADVNSAATAYYKL